MINNKAIEELVNQNKAALLQAEKDFNNLIYQVKDKSTANALTDLFKEAKSGKLTVNEFMNRAKNFK
jgi:hypothetical protein